MRISDSEINSCRSRITRLNNNVAKFIELCESYKERYSDNFDFEKFAQGTNLGESYASKMDKIIYCMEKDMKDAADLHEKSMNCLKTEEHRNAEERRLAAEKKKKEQEEKEKQNQKEE